MARLTRQDYEAFASTIGNLSDHPTRTEVAEAFAKALRGTSPAFNAARFVETALGLRPGVGQGKSLARYEQEQREAFV